MMNGTEDLLYIEDYGYSHIPIMAAHDYGMAYSYAIIGQAVACHLPEYEND